LLQQARETRAAHARAQQQQGGACEQQRHGKQQRAAALAIQRFHPGLSLGDAS
jgi:hypothetical protein